MSNPNGPVRRRRIAGESTPSVEPVESKRKLIPKAKPAAKKTPAAKSAVKKAPAPIPARESAPVRENPAAEPARRGVALPPRSEWRWFIPLAVVTLAAVVFGAWFGYQGVKDFRAERGMEASNNAAAAEAGKAAERIFSFQYNKLPEHLSESKALMTPSFKKEFESIAPALTELAPQRKIQVKAEVRNAAALECGNECSPRKASILVFVDQARLIGDSKTPTVFGNRVEVSMVKSGGTWLVDGITAL